MGLYIGNERVSLRSCGENVTKNITFEQQNEQTIEFVAVAESVYTDDNLESVTIVTDYASDTPNDDAVGYEITITQDGTLFLYDESEPRLSWKWSVTSGSYTIYDLIPEHDYRYIATNASGKSIDNGKIKPTGQVRMIYDDGQDNIRDLGGWTCDGGTIRYGMLYRGGIPSLISTDGKNRMKNRLGIKCQVDFYNNADYPVSSRILYDGVIYNAFPMVDSDMSECWKIDGVYFPTATAAIDKIMENAIMGSPTYFHCWAGADRTGFAAWVLEGLLGVSIKNCSIDYELTSLSGHNRVRTEQANFVAYIQAFGKSTFRDNLLEWCARGGITAKRINGFRKAMSTGTPEEISFNNTVTNNLTNITTSNSATTVTNGSDYSATLTFSEGAALGNVVITMNGKNITDVAWDASESKITISEVTGDIIIIASASVDVASVTYELTNVTSSNNATAVSIGGEYSTMLTTDTGYSVGNVSVLMNGEDITATAWNETTGKIAIQSVSGNIVITAQRTGYINLVDTIGYTADTRISTSSGENRDATGYAVFGADKNANSLIHAKLGSVIRIKGVIFTDAGASAGATGIVFMDSSASTIISATYLKPSVTGCGNCTVSYDGDLTTLTVVSADDTYFRFSGVCTDPSSVIITIDEPIE